VEKQRKPPVPEKGMVNRGTIYCLGRAKNGGIPETMLGNIAYQLKLDLFRIDVHWGAVFYQIPESIQYFPVWGRFYNNQYVLVEINITTYIVAMILIKTVNTKYDFLQFISIDMVLYTRTFR
jgi:hypothetical protein